MANTKISVRIYGNPTSNAGFEPIAIVNNPTFPALEYLGVPGMDTAATYYLLYTAADYTQYTAILENVRSAGASRAGMLKVSIGLPKGYAIGDGKSPYDVLTALVGMFREKYMSNGDQFVPNISTESVKEDIQHVIDQYDVVPVATPWRPMKGTATALVCCQPSQMADLMKDIQYVEFANYKEVVVAETHRDFKGDNLTGRLVIPRKPAWKVVVNGKSYPLSAESPVKLSSCTVLGLDSECYDNEVVEFSLSKISNNDLPKNTKIDSLNETVTWSPVQRAKQVNIKVKIQGCEDCFEYQKIEVRIGKKVFSPTSANYDTYLTGDDIKGTVNVSYTGTSYELQSSNPSLKKNQDGKPQLTIVLQRINRPKNPIVTPSGNTGGSGLVTIPSSPKIVITDIEKSLRKLYGENWEIHWNKIREEGGLEIEVRYSNQSISKTKSVIDRQSQTEIVLPGDWSGQVKIDLPQLKRSKQLMLKPGKPTEVRLDAFTDPMETGRRNGNRIIQWVLFFVLGLLIGGAVGHFVWTTSGAEQQPAATGKAAAKAGNPPKSNPKEEAIKKNIEVYKQILASDDLTFEQVDSIMGQVKQQSEEYQQIDKEFYLMILEYDNVVRAIRTTTKDYLSLAMNIGLSQGKIVSTKTKIHDNHLEMMRTPFVITDKRKNKDVDKAVKEYNKKHTSFTSFKDFNSLVQPSSQPATRNTQGNGGGVKSVTPGGENVLDTKRLPKV